VAKWDTQIPGRQDTIFYTWMSAVVNITYPEVVDIAVNEILDSAEMFGWRGARYDDHYTYWGGRDHEISTRNMKRIFDLGRKRNPKFVWGFNYLVSHIKFSWPSGLDPGGPWRQKHADPGLLPDPVNPRKGKMPAVPGEFAVACRNGGYIMNEEARGAWRKSYGSVKYNQSYTHYAQLLTYEARLTRGLGGHYGPIPFDPRAGSAFDKIFPDILRAASRAHTYGDIRAGIEFRRFITRYSTLIYGTGLKPIVDPEGVLTVKATPGVWWHNYCYTYRDDGAEKIVAHLLGVPRDDRIFENRQGQVSKLRRVRVRYTGPGKVPRAWELSPFIEGFQRAIPVVGNAARPADFYLWTVVVLELEK